MLVRKTSFVQYHLSDHSLKFQGLIGVVVLQGSLGFCRDRINGSPPNVLTGSSVLTPMGTAGSSAGDHDPA